MFVQTLSESASDRYAALLEMVRRRAPVFLRAGGGPLEGAGGSGVEYPSDRFAKIRGDERAEIVRRRRRGESLGAIAVAIGRSAPAVGKVCREEGLGHARPRRLLPDQVEMIRVMRGAGKKFREIAEAIGCAETTVIKRWSSMS